MPELPTEPDETLTYIYNPSKEDFIYPFDSKDYTVPSRTIVSFPKWLADHLVKHLAQKLALEDDGGVHFEDRVKKWSDRIYVNLHD